MAAAECELFAILSDLNLVYLLIFWLTYLKVGISCWIRISSQEKISFALAKECETQHIFEDVLG